MNAPAENLGEGGGRVEVQANHTMQRALSAIGAAPPPPPVTVAAPDLHIQLTVLSNHGGLLTKQYALDQDGTLTKNTKAFLVEGAATKVSISSLSDFSHLLLGLAPNQCLTYGVTEHDVVGIVRKRELHNHPGKIARDRKNFQYRQGPAILMIDYDPVGGQAPLSREELRDCLYKACPELAEASMLWTASASSHISDSRTGADLTGLRGQRFYILVADGTDIPRAGKALYERLWLVGYGRSIVSSAGRLLDRSVIDSSVWQPEREDFAAGAQCVPPLVQRRPEHGCINDPARPFDSRRICDLTVEEQETVARARRDARAVVEEERLTVRATYIEDRALVLASERGITVEAARKVIAEAVDRDILFADFILHPESGGSVTVAEVLDRPEQWHGRRFADPVEPDYCNDGRIAYVNLRSGGRPYLYSHAHGGHRYILLRQPSLLQISPGEMSSLADECLRLIRAQGDLYDFGYRQLVRVAEGRLHPVNSTWLADYLGRIARLERFDRRSSSWVPTDIPERLAKTVCERAGERELPVLRAIVTAPTLREDGSVLDIPGFDTESGLLYLSDGIEPCRVPLNPDGEQVRAALIQLWRPFQMFPFADDVARGAMLSALLSAVIRRSIPTCPGHIFDAPAMGSGKTLLAKCIAALGGHVPELSVHPVEDEEARKSLFASLREGSGCIIWDNVTHPIDGAAINNFLTAPVFKDRILGVSQNEALPNSAMFLATGNNIRVAGDAARRFVVCRIDARVEQPYLREFNFDPLQWVVAHRTELVIAALTLIRGYIAAGSPRMVPGNTASFEVWDRLVRQAVCWVGFGDPMKTVEKNAATDPHKGLLLSILETWFGYLGNSELTSAEAFSKSRPLGPGADLSAHTAFASAVGALSSGKHDDLTAHRLGLYLAKHEDEVIGGYVLHGRQDNHRKVKLWRVERSAQ